MSNKHFKSQIIKLGFVLFIWPTANLALASSFKVQPDCQSNVLSGLILRETQDIKANLNIGRSRESDTRVNFSISMTYKGQEVRLYFTDNHPQFSNKNFDDSREFIISPSQTDYVSHYVKINDTVVPAVNPRQRLQSDQVSFGNSHLVTWQDHVDEEILEVKSRLGNVDQYLPPLFDQFKNFVIVIKRDFTAKGVREASTTRERQLINEGAMRRGQRNLEIKTDIEIYARGTLGERSSTPLLVLTGWSDYDLTIGISD